MTSNQQRVHVNYPDNLHVPVYLASGVTLKDTARIGIPAITGGLLFGLPGAAVGAATGTALSKLPVKGATLDRHAVNMVDNRSTTFHQLSTGPTGTPPQIKDNCFVLPDDTRLAAVEVGSCDLENRRVEDQDALQGLVHDLYREMDFGIDILSREQAVDVSGYAVDRDTVVVPRHLVFVRGDTEDAVGERCRQVRNTLTGNDLYAAQLDGDAVWQAIMELWVDTVDAGMRQYTVHPQFGESRTCRAVSVTGYPDELGLGWLADVLKTETEADVSVMQRVRPGDDKRDWLDDMVKRARLAGIVENNPLQRDAFRKKEEDAADIGRVNDRLVQYEVLITITTPNPTSVDLDTSVNRVKNVLRRHGITYREPLLQTRRAAAARTPIQDTGMDTELIMPAQSAAGGFAFGTADAVEHGGVVFGVDRRDSTPVILDRFSWDAGHVSVMGKIGSGKSFFTKLVLIRSVQQYDNLQVLVVDPKQEYGDIVNGISEYVGRCSRATVKNRAQEDVDVLVDAVHEAYDKGCEWNGKTIVVVDEAHRVLNDEDGRYALGRVVREGRDAEIAMHMVSQNASDFTRTQEGRDILKNVDANMLMRHRDVEASVKDFFNLSRNELAELGKLRTGTDVGFSETLIRGPVNTTLRIEPLDIEEQFIEEAGG